MDKILLTVFLSALAGFITAILSIVKLVNEKESRTTNYRQSWTDSVRSTFANLVALINSQASEIARLRDSSATLHKLHTIDSSTETEDFKKRALDITDNSIREQQKLTRENRRALYEAYALTRLHFKPNDLSFNRIEQKFEIAMGLLNELGKENEETTRAALKERVHGIAGDITDYARDILKIEWETVKRGEPAYQATKKWSIIGSCLMLFLLVSIGIHAVIAMWKANIAEQSQVNSLPVPSSLSVINAPTTSGAPTSPNIVPVK